MPPLVTSVSCILGKPRLSLLTIDRSSCFDRMLKYIEDAPALDSLQKYKVTVQGGEVIVEADEEALSAGKRKPACVKHNKENNDTVVIVGGGASGATTAETLREQGYTGKIRVVSREDYLPIDR